MTQLSYHVVDVFADRTYAGNPLAVVLDADDLDERQMQSMAREFNLSETAFVLRPTTDAATYRARIFTPAVELPFAGHPSVGTAWLLRSLGRVEDGDIVQECGAGLLPITVDDHGAELTGGAVSLSEPVDTAEMAAAVGATDADLVGTPARWCGCGIDWGYVHVHDGFLARAVADVARLERLGHTGVCVFSLQGSTAHARVFAGGAGVPEDAATGSAALGLGVFLVASGLVPGDAVSSVSITQGVEMGRPSHLELTVRAANGGVVEAKVHGRVVPVATGTITAPRV